MSKINVESGGTILSTGLLQLSGGAAMSTTLTAVTDQNNTASPLKLSTTVVQTLSKLQITTADSNYIDAEDNSGNNRFTVGRDPSSQQVNVDFASKPTDLTTSVGAIRTYKDGTNLSESMTFLENGKVGINTTTQTAQLQIKGSGSTSATTSLLVQNSAGDLSFKCLDDLTQQFNGYLTSFTCPIYTGSLQIYSTANNRNVIKGGNGETIVFGQSGNTINLNATETYVSSSFLGNYFWITPNGSFCLGQQAQADASSLFDMRSTTKGFLPPRMTDAQVRAIASPAVGLMAYNTDLDCPVFYSSAGWRKISHSVL